MCIVWGAGTKTKGGWRRVPVMSCWCQSQCRCDERLMVARKAVAAHMMTWQAAEVRQMDHVDVFRILFAFFCSFVRLGRGSWQLASSPVNDRACSCQPPVRQVAVCLGSRAGRAAEVLVPWAPLVPVKLRRGSPRSAVLVHCSTPTISQPKGSRGSREWTMRCSLAPDQS